MLQRVFTIEEQKRVSDDHALDAWYDYAYNQAFPTLIRITNMRNDPWAKEQGIETKLTLANGIEYYVDEIVRTSSYNDVALQYWHRYAVGRSNGQPDLLVKGWVNFDRGADLVAYQFSDSSGLLMPQKALCRIWDIHGKEWEYLADNRLQGFRSLDSKNDGYISYCACVPIDILLAAFKEVEVRGDLQLIMIRKR